MTISPRPRKEAEMPEHTEQQIDAAAKYLRETMQAGKNLTAWDHTPKATKKKWLALAAGTLAAARLAGASA